MAGESADPARHYAGIRAFLKQHGTMIGANELFIAAHARADGLTPVTNNTAEFARVPDLTIANWTSPTRGQRRPWGPRPASLDGC
jgi:tRNA(fMet)-specific endonuclease VapC